MHRSKHKSAPSGPSRPRKPSISARLAAPGTPHPREDVWSSRYVGNGSDWLDEWTSKPGRR